MAVFRTPVSRSLRRCRSLWAPTGSAPRSMRAPSTTSASGCLLCGSTRTRQLCDATRSRCIARDACGPLPATLPMPALMRARGEGRRLHGKRTSPLMFRAHAVAVALVSLATPIRRLATIPSSLHITLAKSSSSLLNIFIITLFTCSLIEMRLYACISSL